MRFFGNYLLSAYNIKNLDMNKENKFQFLSLTRF
jgi:hypothetical protein